MKMLTKIFLGVLVFFVVGFSVFAILRAPKTKRRPLIVGMMSGWAPFMVVNDQGTFEGFDIDVAQELAKRLNKPIEIQDIGSLSSLLLALDQGKIDLAMSGLDITEARRQKVIMLPYTGQTVTTLELVFWQKIPAGITTMQDLKTLETPMICVEPGSSQEKFLDQFPWVTAKALSKVEDMVLDVMYGKSLALLVEPQVAKRITRQNNQLKSLAISIPKSFQTFGMGIALTLKNKTLASKIESVLKRMRADGMLTKLEEKWKLTESA